MNDSASIFEKLGIFYLGREFSLAEGRSLPTPLLYESRDLLTHAVIVGMTGSGKTGLGIGLLEEAAIDGIPALIVDPKGDLGNLLLTFPDLQPGDFAPWLHEEDARRAGMSVDQYAAAQADRWREGLQQWDQDGQRIARLREAAEFVIYTPGSESGQPVSILASFAAPPQAILEDPDLLRDRVSTTTTSLLGLMGLTVDPLRSREHILLTNILEDAWRQAQNLDLGQLIQRVQNPPFHQVGVMDLESFFPARDRFELAMLLNNLLAAPTFAAWLQGPSLNVNHLLHSPSGKPRLSIFSIAHLSDAERMFFVSLLLNEVLGWMRSCSGTTSLRALLYIDELLGYMPPVSNPPSKKPLLTLLKQARAFGLGIVLATQNPVDLDYKGLSNAGTWFLGRLQTERDKQRVMEGLTSASLTTAESLPSGPTADILSQLGQRVFLMHNVHEDQPTVFQTRWTLSYLAGPLTRQQIRSLKPPLPEKQPASPDDYRAPSATSPSTSASPEQSTTRPIVPPELPQVFLPRVTRSDAGVCAYVPHLLAVVRMHYVQTRKGLAADEDLMLLLPIEEHMLQPDWHAAHEVPWTEQDLQKQSEEPCTYAPLPSLFGHTRRYSEWRKSLANHLYRTRRYELFRSRSLGEFSRPGESERDFRIRLVDQARQERDRQIEALREKYASKFRTLEERIRRAEQTVEREAREAQSAKVDSLISVGASVLGALIGRKRFGSTQLGRATSAARGLGKASDQAEQVRQAQDTLAAYERQWVELQAQVDEEVQRITQQLDPLQEQLEVVPLKPRKTDVDIRLMALAWRPTDPT